MADRAVEHQWEEFKIVQDVYVKMWQMYLNWFTWFYGVNLLAMSWVFTSEKMNKALVAGLALLMIFCLIMGVLLSFIMYSYSESARKIGRDLQV